MATTDTGPLGTLTFISAEAVDPDGTGEKYLRVRYSLDTTGATEALTGFYIWHDDEAGSTTPVWANACDAKKAGGGDYGTPTIYEVLVPVPLATTGAIWWESFEEYAAELYGYHGFGDDFEGYSLGAISVLDKGTGFNGNGVVR